MQSKLYSLLAVFFLTYFNTSGYAQVEDLEKLTAAKTTYTAKEACAQFNHKLLVYADVIYYFKNCTLHLIEDVDLTNTLIQTQGIKPLIMNPQLFASLKMGNNYTFQNYESDYLQDKHAFSLSLCKKFNKYIVSLDDYSFYYIDMCKKRKLNNYLDVEKFDKKSHPILAISESELNHFPEGKPVVVREIPPQKDESEREINEETPNKQILCKKLEHKITAFYESFYYVESCTLRPISELTLALQQKAQAAGGIKELKIEQVLGLKEGKPMTEKEVFGKFK